MFEVSDTQKIGVGLAAFGLFFLFLGILLLFDKGLLAIGNILFICGLACVIGLERTFRFFFQRHKFKATVAFFSGITIVLLGWPFTGMLIETYGFVLLFSGFFPVAVDFLRRIPILGTLLSLPGIRGAVSFIVDHSGIHLSTTSKIIKKVSRSLALLSPDFIFMPTDQEETIYVKHGFYLKARFPNCVSAVDCTHFKIQSPGGENTKT